MEESEGGDAAGQRKGRQEGSPKEDGSHFFLEGKAQDGVQLIIRGRFRGSTITSDNHIGFN